MSRAASARGWRRRLARLALLLGAIGVLALLVVPSALSCVMPGAPDDDPRFAHVVRRTLSAPTGSVSYLSAGDPLGPRLIFVHGTPGDATAWLDYLADPLPGWESVAPDRPGFGCSEPEGAVGSLALQAAAIEPLLVQRRGRWPVLVGHSLGGPIVARVAADHPDRVGGLLVLAGSLDPGLEEWRWYNRVGSLLEPVLARPIRNSNRELEPLRAELVALEERLDRVTCPVIVMHGTDDSLVPFENVAYMQAAFTLAARVDVRRIEGGDHFLPWNAEPTVREALAELAGAER